MVDEIKATYKLKYECKGSKRYETQNDEFPIKDVYVLRPWSNHVEEFTLTMKPKMGKTHTASLAKES